MLDIHASGKAVSVKPQYRLKLPISPQVLNGFNSDEAFRRDHSMYMHSRDFLPMPVHVSPLLCVIIPKQWTERYTDSFKSFSMLRNIVQCYTVNPFLNYYQANKVRINKAREKEVDDTMKLEEKLRADLTGVTDNRVFVEIMERSTIDRIRIYEECVREMFGIDIPLEHCLTPVEFPAYTGKYEDVVKLLNHFFEIKQEIRNVRMEKALPDDAEFTPVKYFTPIEDAENLYKSYLTPKTATEYMNFCNPE